MTEEDAGKIMWFCLNFVLKKINEGFYIEEDLTKKRI